MKPLTATAILIFAVVNLSAATTLYYGAYPGHAAQTGPAMPLGSGVCSSNPTPSLPASSPSLTAVGAGPDGPYLKEVEVSILSGSVNDEAQAQFSPQVVTLVVGVNNTVTWSNLDVGEANSVASYSVPAGAAPFASGAISVGSTYSYTFTALGAYYYHCAECPWMTGVIIVK